MNPDGLFKFRLGQQVRIGVGITAVIEEIILARGQNAPFYLVEWWHEGQMVARRMHEADCRAIEPMP